MTYTKCRPSLVTSQMRRGTPRQEAAAESCRAQARPRQRPCGGVTGCRWRWWTRWPSGESGRNSSCSPTPRTCPSPCVTGPPSRCPWCTRLQRSALVREAIHLSIHPSIDLFIHPSLYLSIHTTIYSSTHPPIHPTIYTPIYPSIIALSMNAADEITHWSCKVNVQYLVWWIVGSLTWSLCCSFTKKKLCVCVYFIEDVWYYPSG